VVGNWTNLPTVQVPNPDNDTADDGAQLTVGPSGDVAVAFARWVPSNAPGTPIYVSVNTGGLNGQFPTATIVHASNMNTPTPRYHPPAQPDKAIHAQPFALAWGSYGSFREILYLVYADLPDTTQNDHYNVYLKYSTDQGVNWVPHVPPNEPNPGILVNNDSTSNFNSHLLPSMAVDPTSGNIAVCWYDCRNDPNNVHTQFFAAVSSDGGQTFPSNYMLEAQSYYSNAPGTPIDYWDYTGMAYYAGYFYSAWADNSNSTGGNPSTTTPKEMDIYVVKFRY
jgi:hypothetical protein